jgi:hypothetical protein
LNRCSLYILNSAGKEEKRMKGTEKKEEADERQMDN